MNPPFPVRCQASLRDHLRPRLHHAAATTGLPCVDARTGRRREADGSIGYDYGSIYHP